MREVRCGKTDSCTPEQLAASPGHCNLPASLSQPAAPCTHFEVCLLVLGAIMRQQAHLGWHNLWRCVGREAGHLAPSASLGRRAQSPELACRQGRPSAAGGGAGQKSSHWGRAWCTAEQSALPPISQYLSALQAPAHSSAVLALTVGSASIAWKKVFCTHMGAAPWLVQQLQSATQSPQPGCTKTAQAAGLPRLSRSSSRQPAHLKIGVVCPHTTGARLQQRAH